MNSGKTFWALIYVVLLPQIWSENEAVRRLLQMDKESELIEKLVKYDINEDGSLSDEEINLGQPHIQKYLNQYFKLMDNANKERDEENAEIKPVTETNNGKTNQVLNDDDDEEVTVQVEDEVEVIADEKNSDKTENNEQLWQIVAGAVGGIVVFIFIMGMLMARSARLKDSKEQEELIQLRKQEWLDRMSQKTPAQAMPSSSSRPSESLPSKQFLKPKNTMLRVSSQKKNALPTDISPDSSTESILMARSARLKDSKEQEELIQLKKQEWLDCLSQEQPDQVMPSSSLRSSESHSLPSKQFLRPKNTMLRVSSQKKNALPTDISPDSPSCHEVQKSQEIIDQNLLPLQDEITRTFPSKNFQTRDSNENSKHISTSLNNVARKSSAKTSITDKTASVGTPVIEKTVDMEKAEKFLQDVLNCAIIIESDSKAKTRYVLGKLYIAASSFPTTVEEVDEKIPNLILKVFDRQINKVNFSIITYNNCETFCGNYHDGLVDAMSVKIREEAVRTIASHFNEESEKSIVEQDLWSIYGEDKVESFEARTFLKQLTQNANAETGLHVSSTLLTDLLAHENGIHLVEALLRAGGQCLLAVKRLDELPLAEGITLAALEVLISNTHFSDILGKIFTKEAQEAAKHGLGNYFELKSVFGQLLSISTLPSTSTSVKAFSMKPQAVIPFQSLRGFPNISNDDRKTAQTLIMNGIQRIQQFVFSALRRVVSNKLTRESGLAWLATVIGLNEMRTAAILQESEGQLPALQPACSDGYMLNFCAVVLELFMPIASDQQKLSKVSLAYYTSPACRINFDFEPCLVGALAVNEKQHKQGRTSTELQAQESFITECYHLVQRALNVGLSPIIKHFFSMHSFYHAHIKALEGSDKDQDVKNAYTVANLVWETCLLDSDLARNITTFYLNQATLLLQAINKEAEKTTDQETAAQAQRKLLSVIPEFCIRDMAKWFSLLANAVLRIHPYALKGLELTPFVDCCVMMLERTDFKLGPLAASEIVSALLSFMKTSNEDVGLGQGWGSGILSDLAAIVHACPSAQTKLGPALLRTYVSVDVVEGLDVDKENFDKYNSRVEIGQLAQKLWSRSDCRSSIISQCGSEHFQNFLGSILDTLLYMLHDSLSRLANVKKMEILKGNEAEWKALSALEKANKEKFLRNEEGVAAGFMRQAKKTLDFLDLITQSEEVALCFTQQPLAARAASAINGFLESLCGTKAKDFKVKDMAKYNFNPGDLLLTIVNIILRIALQDRSPKDGFLVCMAKDLDFEISNLEKAESVIGSKGLADETTVDGISQLVQQLKKFSVELRASISEESVKSKDADWVEAMLDIELDPSVLEKDYYKAMSVLRFNSAHIFESHSFQNSIQELDPRSPKVKAVMKEMKQLQQNLPVHPDASIFVLQDEDRMDLMRALITGPTGTPYSLGCFCFDIYFPSTYPNNPPLVKIITTGNGTVRFNPNLYADGKVCLSLLGTWHAGDASEKWNPGKSSLYQVLVSVQSMILTPDPVFNEPGYEGLRNTEEGAVQSQQYNWKLHLHTLRHAILGQLRNPPPGMERAVRFHFALQREALLKQCAEWIKECQDQDLLKRIRQAADAIFEELMCLEVDFSQKMSEEEDEDDDI